MSEKIEQLETINVEPHFTNRWFIRAEGLDKFHFQKYKLKTFFDEKNNEVKTVLQFKILNTFGNHYLPINFYLNKLRIEYVDATGVMVDYIDLKVRLNQARLIGDYKKSKVSSCYKVEYNITEMSNLKEETLDKKILDNYITNMEKEHKNNK